MWLIAFLTLYLLIFGVWIENVLSKHHPWLEQNEITTFDEKFLRSALTLALRNKHLVFITDSVGRYQYISLLHLLTYGKVVNGSAIPNPIWEKSFDSFNNFYNYTNGLFTPYEWCDCSRGSLWNQYFENRFYYNPKTNIRISYVQYFADAVHCHGHWHNYSSSDSFREPKNIGVESFWVYTLPDCLNWAKNLYIQSNHPEAPKVNAFDNISSDFQTIAILNAGHHPHQFGTTQYAHSIAQYGVATFDRFIWKTTTGKRKTGPDVYYHHDDIMCNYTGVVCYNLSWTKHLNKNEWYDEYHFRSHIYDLMNIQLLKGLLSDSPTF